MEALKLVILHIRIDIYKEGAMRYNTILIAMFPDQQQYFKLEIYKISQRIVKLNSFTFSRT